MRVALCALVACTLALASAVAAGERPGGLDARIATIASGDDVQALGVVPDGRIVVAGTRRSGAPARVFVRAYLPTGGPDPRFGSGGEVLFESHRWVGDMAVKRDGRIVLALTFGPPRLVRLNSDGSRDESFGAAGTVDPDLGGPTFLEGLALQGDGRVVAVGTSSPGATPEVAATRFVSDGSPDPGFGDGGRVTIATPGPAVYTSAAVQPNGQVVLAMQGDESGPWIARISADGRLDPTFGRGGVAPLDLGRRRWRGQVDAALGYSWRPLILRDGRIRVPVSFGPRERVTRIGLVGLTSRGRVDHRFGEAGLALGPRLRVAEGGEWPRVALHDRHGSILVAGSASRGDDLTGDDATVLRRFRPSGRLDLSFGRRGLVSDSLRGAGSTFEQELAMLDGDTVVLAQETATTRYQQWHGGSVQTRNAGYDRKAPSISVAVGCRYVRVRARDRSGIDVVVVRVDGRVVRRSARGGFRIRTPNRGDRLVIRARDLAGNSRRTARSLDC